MEIADLEDAVERLTRNIQDYNEQGIELISAFDSIPPSSTFPPTSILHPPCTSRSTMFLSRYKSVQSRVKKLSVFKTTKINRSKSEGGVKIDKIGALLGRGVGEKVFLLAMITPTNLEDDTGICTYTFSPHLPPSDGYITSSSIVLIEATIKGSKEGEVEVEIKEVRHPPYEGGEERRERGKEEQMVVVLTEVNMDRERTVSNLRTVMSGFEDMLTSQLSDDPEFPPPVVVMMGGFKGNRDVHSKKGREGYKMVWSKMEVLLREFTNMSKMAKFVFVPGSSDPTPTPLPQLPIPKYFTTPLLNSPFVQNVHFASNPCRLKFHGKEVVIYNNPGLTQMLAKSKVAGEDRGVGSVEHTFKTVLDQGHLCPVEGEVQPVYWNLDEQLRLSPPPSGLILGSSTSGNGTGNEAALHYSPDENKEGTYCVETGR